MKKKSVAKIKMKWHFPDLDNGEADGFNDPILQYFEGDYERYIAREAIQNSIDARIEYKEPVPALITFEYKDMPTNTIPGISELKERLSACLKRSQKNKDEKGAAFFNEALQIINSNTIPILRVSDFNTKGLEGGDEDESGSWYKLVRAVGENRMTGAGGGSFGIGKGAPIAASQVHTVYYSTLNTAGEFIFQGKTRLITHEFQGRKKRGSGFFGIDGYKSVRKKNDIPKDFLRTETGTDVFVIAYKPEGQDWKAELIKSVLTNFWMAVHAGDLVVNFKDKDSNELIDQSSLEQMLLTHLPNDSYQYYLATINPTRKEEKSLPTLGNCELFLRQDPNLIDKRDVLLMRLPKMVVKRRPFRVMNDGFVGVMICNNSEGNKLLRDMEPPKHDEWDYTLAPDKIIAKRALYELFEWMKSILKELANSSKTDPEEIPELDRFLPLEDDGSGAGLGFDDTKTWNGFQSDESPKEVSVSYKETENEIENVVQRFNAMKRASGVGQLESWQQDGSGGGTGTGGGQNSETSPTGDAISKINTDSIKFRSIAVKDKTGNVEYCLILNPSTDQVGAINIIAVGDDSNYAVSISSAADWSDNTLFETKGSMIKNIKLFKGKTRKIRLRLTNERIRYALGIESYEG